MTGTDPAPIPQPSHSSWWWIRAAIVGLMLAIATTTHLSPPVRAQVPVIDGVQAGISSAIQSIQAVTQTITGIISSITGFIKDALGLFGLVEIFEMVDAIFRDIEDVVGSILALETLIEDLYTLPTRLTGQAQTYYNGIVRAFGSTPSISTLRDVKRARDYTGRVFYSLDFQTPEVSRAHREVRNQFQREVYVNAYASALSTTAKARDINTANKSVTSLIGSASTARGDIAASAAIESQQLRTLGRIEQLLAQLVMVEAGRQMASDPDTNINANAKAAANNNSTPAGATGTSP